MIYLLIELIIAMVFVLLLFLLVYLFNKILSQYEIRRKDKNDNN